MRKFLINHIFIVTILDLCCLVHSVPSFLSSNVIDVNWYDLTYGDGEVEDDSPFSTPTTTSVNMTYDEETTTMSSYERRKFDIHQKMRSLKIECVDVSKVDPEMVLKLQLGIWPEYPHISLGKYMLCILNKLKIMSREGVFKLDEALKHIPHTERDEAIEKIDKCLYLKKKLPHEKAYFYMKCINSENPKEFNIF